MSSNLSPLKQSKKSLFDRVLKQPDCREIIFIIVIFLATLLINSRMLRAGLNGMTDLKWHATWIQHFSQQLSEGIWYPRWLAGTNYGYGSPTFVFYPPLVYYFASSLKLIGLNVEQIIIFLCSFSLFLAGFNFYLFGRSRWGKIAACLGAIAYISAPYLAFNIYWIGSLSVAFAIALLPLGWWLTDRALQIPKWRIGVSLFWAILALTHLPSLLLFGIVWLFYSLFFLLKYSWKPVVAILVHGAIGLGIASLYLLPAIAEQSLVNIEHMKSVVGNIENGTIGAGLPLFPFKFDFHVAHIFIHQFTVIILLIIISFCYEDRNQKKQQEIYYWLIFSFLLAFLMSSLSLPIWQASETLQKVQAPWRLLSVFSFTGAVIFAVLIDRIISSNSRFKFLAYCLVILIFSLNISYSYRLARKFPTIHQSGRANLEYLEYFRQTLDSSSIDNLIDVTEYRPLLKNGSAALTPKIGQPQVLIATGKGNFTIDQWDSYNRIFRLQIDERANLKIRTYYYPAWHLYVNDRSHQIDVNQDGTMGLTLEPGFYTIRLSYQKTFAFQLGIFISILSLLILTITLVLPKKVINFIEN